MITILHMYFGNVKTTCIVFIIVIRKNFQICKTNNWYKIILLSNVNELIV